MQETELDYRAKLAGLPFLSVAELAALVGVPMSTLETELQRMRDADFTGPRLKIAKVGRTRIVARADAEAWLTARAEAA